MLQYSIRNVDQPVDLSEEIQWLTDYMYLQEKRFANLFHYTLSINDSLLDCCMIYKLLLQPVLENSILHAFDSPAPENHITVTITPLLMTNQFEIVIADNGRGIPEDVLAQIQDCLEHKQTVASEHIGILSAYHRLQAYYGDSASMTIHSDSSGTTTRFLLPILLTEENEVNLL